MPVRNGAKSWTVKEQIVEDPVSGLTFQFEVVPDGEVKLKIFGESLPMGNREISFTENGKQVGAGTFTGLCRPAWLQEIED